MPSNRKSSAASAAPAREKGRLGLFLATMLVASNMIGSGIFLLPATLASVGSLTLLAWVASAAAALVLARLFGRLGRYRPIPGGPCAYAAEALGPAMGFQATAIYWLALWTGNIAIALAAVGYLASVVPAFGNAVPLALGAIALVWAMTVFNLFGPRPVAQLESASFFIGLVPILLVAAAGWWRFHPAIFLAGWNVSGAPAGRAFARSLVPTFWAFAGVESASIATAVVENPERNIARATYGGVLIAAVVYIAACAAIMGMIPAAVLARSTAPFADAVRLLFGPGMAALVAVMAMTKAIGTLGGWVLLTAETGERGADHGLFPAMFRRRRGARAPLANLMLVGVLMSAGVVATVSPTLGDQFGEIISVSVILSLLLYIYTGLAVWHYARRAPAAFRHDRAFAAAAIAYCAFAILLSGIRLLELTAAIVAAAMLLAPLRRLGRGANA